ncbi:MAG: TetR/AcrR family transcriptional regulator [Spirochaetales bacterium]|nr:TetR/AcrR family transcriptional regulator [Spirochaetales bacterium]
MNLVFKNLEDGKKQRFRDVALKEFAEKGFERASTNEIVKTLGIAKGSLFKYFSTKEDLYAYLVDEVTDQLVLFLQDLVLDSNQWDYVLLSYAGKEFDFLIKYPVLHQFFSVMIRDLDNPKLGGIREKLLKASSSYLEGIYKKIEWVGTKDEIIFFQKHITYIIKGYNEEFISYDKKYNSVLKEKYLNGLKEHFNFIKKNQTT